MQLPRPPRRRQSVVLTSLVDVMFVLLFFFMLAAGGAQHRAIAVGLPAPAGAASASGERLLQLVGTDRWRLDGVELAPAALAQHLAQPGPGAVRIQPQAGATAQMLTDALVAVRTAGLAPRLSAP